MHKGLFNWLLPSIRFNLRYLPFKQAVKLPIYLYRPRFHKLGGSVEILSDEISRGMVKIGFPETTLFLGSKYTVEINGKVRFLGSCHLGCGGVISVGSKGLLEVGGNVTASDNTKLICFHYVKIGEGTTLGWDCTLCDTDFHAMKNAFTEKKMKAYAPIKLGRYNWLGSSCHVLKGTVTPDYTTVSACSFLNKRYRCAEKSILSGNPAVIVSEGCFYRDMKDDRFEYAAYEKI